MAVTLDVGTYRLVVSGSNTSMASYSFKLLDVTTPDHFNLSLNSESSGNIDRLGSVDEWTFVAVQGQRVSLNVLSIGGNGQRINFDLVDSHNSIWMTSFAYSGGPNDGDRGAVTLDAGTYRLVVSGSNTSMASYSFMLLDVVPPDIGTLTLGQPVSGNIEQVGSRDEWTFNGTVGETISFNVGSIANSAGQGLIFTLVGPSGYLTSATGTAAQPQAGNLQHTLTETRAI
ncbi:MAG: hypothetical protein U1D30_08010 [Planctomycetota bacterium]